MQNATNFTRLDSTEEKLNLTGTILNRYGALKKGTVYQIRRLTQAVTTEGPCSHLSVEVLAGLVILHLVLQERPLAHLDVHDVRVAERMQEVFQLDECLPSILHFAKIPSNTRHALDISTLNIHITTILVEEDKSYTPKRLVNSFVVNVFLKEIKLSHECFSSVFYYSKDFFIIPVFVTLFIIVQGQLIYGRSKL